MTVVSKHWKLDAAIMKAITEKRGFIYLRALPEVSETALHSVRNPDDVLNGRLQILRKQGRIFFGGGCWQLTESEKQAAYQEHPDIEAATRAGRGLL